MWLKNPSSSSYPFLQVPGSDTGTLEPNTSITNYPISFEQDMQMFNNNGNETFTFMASYSDIIAVKNGIQMGGIDGSNGIQWAIRIDTAIFSPRGGDLQSLKIMARNNAFYIDPIADSQVFNITVDCRFTV
ncbi:hypothetical protein ONZ45_g12151 [Pleurotus djamor]|nr:hypothetical protein ONZ45_g12151 [Pleurotus djamor]